MANFSVNNVTLTGISAAVPSHVVDNLDNSCFSESEKNSFIKNVGVRFYRHADSSMATSDLGYVAAKKLLEAMEIDKGDIDILIFVSQTPDYLNIPNTAPILQDRLGLSKNTLSFDLSLGCSGFVYGMSVVCAYLQNHIFRKALLICGDTIRKVVNPLDKGTALLFGDAVSAAVFERKSSVPSIYFNLGSDGAGHRSIMIEDGGYRHRFSTESLVLENVGDGSYRRKCDLKLEGMDVFSFGITQAVQSIRESLDFARIRVEELDYAVFHQANLMMNEVIRKKLALPKEKVPYSLYDYGNTSSASIPLTLVSALKTQIRDKNTNLLLCGFGVGLSWASCLIRTGGVVVPDIIEC